MNILIIENEMYLAEKIISRLLDEGHICDYIESSNINNLTNNYDVVLLSTSLSHDLCQKIIKKYKQSIIILLVTYVSNDTLSSPLENGADDYIMKPFIMDELLRKIYHYEHYNNIKMKLENIKDYLDFTFKNIKLNNDIIPNSFPILIETKCQKCADKFVLNFSEIKKLSIDFITLDLHNWKQNILDSKKDILYLNKYHTLKKNIKEQVLKIIENKKCILVSSEEEDFPYQKIKFNQENSLIINGSIISINDYLKLMVLSFQDKYPDTELSKKLGISRKSLWEKRKKLNISRKK